MDQESIFLVVLPGLRVTAASVGWDWGGVVYGGLDAAPRARDYTYFSIEEGRSYSSTKKGRKQNNTMTTHPLYSA